jgi:cytochrome c5
MRQAMAKSGKSRTVLLGVIALSCLYAIFLSAQTLKYTRRPDAAQGETVYKGGCIACHGSEGKGAPETSTVFTRPDTWPDFTRCDQTTPEANSAWKAVIVHGGKSRAFSQIMPAFGDLLTNDQIDDVIAYMRGFCKNVHHYPLGELNLPRAIVTEKAFPEDELVLSTALNATGAPNYTTDVIHEQTFAGRNQIEVDVPVNYADKNHNWTSGVGDITLGFKREMFSSLRTGSILSLQGGVLLPTGDSNRGFGSGTTTFEPFAAFDQLFKENTFFEFQAGADIPVSTTNTPRSIFWRATAGQSLSPDHRLGRLFSPMVEMLAVRNFRTGASTNWDVLPELQMTVSRRQHIRAAVGVRTPFTNTNGRSPQVAFYVLWDRADGKLWEGWR